MNAEGRWQGQADPPLSAEGVIQARELGARLATQASDGGRRVRDGVLFASDLQRAAETARLIGEPLGVVPTLHVGLREMHVGEWSGLRHAEIAARWPEQLARFRAGDRDVRPGGGESRRMLAARVTAALDEIRAAADGRPIALVTHLGVLRALVPGIQLANAEHLWLEPDAGRGADPGREPDAPEVAL